MLQRVYVYVVKYIDISKICGLFFLGVFIFLDFFSVGFFPRFDYITYSNILYAILYIQGDSSSILIAHPIFSTKNVVFQNLIF